MIASCVFYACKMQREPRSPKEIADIYDLEIKHVHRGCRKILDYIDLNSTFYQIKNSQAADFIERLSKKLDIIDKVEYNKNYYQQNKDRVKIVGDFECPYCSKISSLANKLRHLKSHHPEII